MPPIHPPTANIATVNAHNDFKPDSLNFELYRSL